MKRLNSPRYLRFLRDCLNKRTDHVQYFLVLTELISNSHFLVDPTLVRVFPPMYHRGQQLSVLPIRLWDVPEAYRVSLKPSAAKTRGSGLHCDCNARWLKAWLLERKLDDITCATPAHLTGTTVTKLRDSDFVCGECPQLRNKHRLSIIHTTHGYFN